VTADLPFVYRLHARTSCEDIAAVFDYLLENQLVAVGWGAGDTKHTWRSYGEAAGSDTWYGEVNSSVRAMHSAENGALVWMRDPRGAYYLARIDGPWRYLRSARTAYLDLWNARPATIMAVGVESRVPGKVANAFIRGQAFRHIWDSAARRYTQSLWERLIGEEPSYRPAYRDILRSLLDPEALEDLVAVYLQREHGYLALPASRRASTPGYEYVLRHPDTGRQALVQVKTGNEPCPRDRRALPVEHVEDVFVFSAGGTYSGRRAKRVTELSPEALIAFMREQAGCLPPTVEHWTDLARGS